MAFVLDIHEPSRLQPQGVGPRSCTSLKKFDEVFG
jgi:hypothetical protein